MLQLYTQLFPEGQLCLARWVGKFEPSLSASVGKTLLGSNINKRDESIQFVSSPKHKSTAPWSFVCLDSKKHE